MYRLFLCSLLLVVYACQPNINPQETKEEISPKARLDREGYTKSHISSNESMQMEGIAVQLCSGELDLKAILNFTVDGNSLKHYLNQDISTFKEEDLKNYSEARERAKCCLKAITENAECEYLRK